MKTDFTAYSSVNKLTAIGSQKPVDRDRNFLVLIVENDEEAREEMRVMLELQGYSVMVAADPEEAQSIFSRYRDETGLIIVNIILPEMNGWELAFELKRLKPGTPVLFCSDYHCDIVRMDRNDRYIAKPFEMAELTGIIDSMV